MPDSLTAPGIRAARCLAVDTALGACSCAVLQGDQLLARHWMEMSRGHAEAVAPMVQIVMAEAGLTFAEIDRLAVTTGPGTFTGQRVGLAFMRGLRVALKRPLIGISTLEAMAGAAQAETGLDYAAALHDARRGEVYFQLLRGETSLIGPSIAPLEQAMAQLAEAAGSQKLALAGTAAEAGLVLRSQASLSVTRLSAIRQPDAVWVGLLALRRVADDLAPAPLYLRPPDAKLPGGKSVDHS